MELEWFLKVSTHIQLGLGPVKVKESEWPLKFISIRESSGRGGFGALSWVLGFPQSDSGF